MQTIISAPQPSSPCHIPESHDNKQGWHALSPRRAWRTHIERTNQPVTHSHALSQSLQGRATQITSLETVGPLRACHPTRISFREVPPFSLVSFGDQIIRVCHPTAVVTRECNELNIQGVIHSTELAHAEDFLNRLAARQASCCSATQTSKAMSGPPRDVWATPPMLDSVTVSYLDQISLHVQFD